METIYSYFKKQVVRNSNEIAVFDENRSLTFKQLDRLVDTIAMSRAGHRWGMRLSVAAEYVYIRKCLLPTILRDDVPT